MKKSLGIIVLIGIAVVFILVGILRKGGGGEERRIAVIPKGTIQVFWQSIRAGAEKAGGEAGVKIFWNGPEREGDREKQIQIIEDFIIQKVSGVVIAPLDDKSLVPSIEKLAKENIPCVIIDSSVDTDKYVTFAATDNYIGGVIAARRMGKILNEKGKIIFLKYAPGSASTTKRENGFLTTIEEEFPGIEIIDTKYGMDTVETALQAIEDLLTRNPEFDGLFACNESTTTGALRGLQGRGIAGKVKFIGFDSSPLLIEGLKKGHIDSLVVQNPYKMGYEGVKSLVAFLDGKEVVRRIDTGVELVTQERLAEVEIKEMLHLK